MQQYNILLLLQLFDKHIYSSITENLCSESLENFIAIADINTIFDTTSELLNSLEFYSQYLVRLTTDKECIFPLIEEYHLEKEGLYITHNQNAIRHYLYRNNHVTIYNGAIQLLFAKAFTHSNHIYSFLSKGYEHTCTPDELRALLQMNYSNSFLLPRVLRPAENAIYSLFQNAKIPFYFTSTLQRSMLGKGGKIIGVNFQVIDYVVSLRQNRLRGSYIVFIIESLKKFFPWDFPFYREKIEMLNDVVIEDIFKMIKNLDKDPDYNKIDPSILIRYKLQEQFGVKPQVD